MRDIGRDREELPERAADDGEQGRDGGDARAGGPGAEHGQADQRSDTDRHQAELVLGDDGDDGPESGAQDHREDPEADGLAVAPARPCRRFVHDTYFALCGLMRTFGLRTEGPAGIRASFDAGISRMVPGNLV